MNKSGKVYPTPLCSKRLLHMANAGLLQIVQLANWLSTGETPVTNPAGTDGASRGCEAAGLVLRLSVVAGLRMRESVRPHTVLSRDTKLSGGRSIGIVHSRTKATELLLLILSLRKSPLFLLSPKHRSVSWGVTAVVHFFRWCNAYSASRNILVYYKVRYLFYPRVLLAVQYP
jgi:hypothetical protein